LVLLALIAGAAIAYQMPAGQPGRRGHTDGVIWATMNFRSSLLRTQIGDYHVQVFNSNGHRVHFTIENVGQFGRMTNVTINAGETIHLDVHRNNPDRIVIRNVVRF